MRWKSEAGKNDLYVPGARVVGTEAAVTAWLRSHNHSLDVLALAFRAGDQTTSRYKDAVKAARTPRLPKAPAVATPKSKVVRMKSPLRMVRQFNARIDLDQPIKLRNQRNEEKTSPCKSALLKRVRPGEEDTTEDTVLGAPMVSQKHLAALQKRMDDLPHHKVLDVSTYDPSTGKGARLVPRPAPRDLTRRGVEGVPLVARTGDSLRTLLGLLGLHDRVASVTW